VPFERFCELKDFIEHRYWWSRVGGKRPSSAFEKQWKPKSWNSQARFLFVRTVNPRQTRRTIAYVPCRRHTANQCYMLCAVLRTTSPGSCRCAHGSACALPQRNVRPCASLKKSRHCTTPSSARLEDLPGPPESRLLPSTAIRWTSDTRETTSLKPRFFEHLGKISLKACEIHTAPSSSQSTYKHQLAQDKNWKLNYEKKEC
jgi:hypothetical protein